MRATFFAVLVFGGSILAGCGCPQIAAWERAWGDIRQPYLDYVAADAKLSETEKAMRFQHVALLDLTLKDLKK
jgi:hypothetical protein